VGSTSVGDNTYNSTDDSKNNYESSGELKTYDIGLAVSAGLAKKVGSGNIFVEFKSSRGFIDNVSDSYREDVLKIYYPELYKSAHMYNFNTCIMFGYNYNFKSKK